MAITNVRKVSNVTGDFSDFGWANITVQNGNTSVTADFPELQLPLYPQANVTNSAGLQRSGFVVTTSGSTVTVANNGTTTTFASGDIVTVVAFSERGI